MATITHRALLDLLVEKYGYTGVTSNANRDARERYYRKASFGKTYDVPYTQRLYLGLVTVNYVRRVNVRFVQYDEAERISLFIGDSHIGTMGDMEEVRFMLLAIEVFHKNLK